MLNSDTANASHVAQLNDSLQQLQLKQQISHPTPDDAQDADSGPHSALSHLNSSVSWNLHTKDGYGFRKSGVSTPLSTNLDIARPIASPNELVPDPNGLGWPGKLPNLALIDVFH